MSAHRFFLTAPLPSNPGDPLPLTPADVRHAVLALRVQPGELLDVVEPDSRAWSCEVLSADPGAVCVRVLAPIDVPAEPDVTLLQGVAKGDKMDDVVRQAVEVGATRIVPLLMERSIVRLDADKRATRGERWRRIAQSAAKQAKRTRVPVVDDPIELRDALPLLGGFDGVVVAWEDSDDDSLSDVVSRFELGRFGRVAVVVGPEGGLSAEEIELLRDAGGVTASLGSNILRTETAAIVALALASAALGGMGGHRE